MSDEQKQEPMERRLRRWFSERFVPTQYLLTKFSSERSHASEFVVLASSRLDALANLGVAPAKTQRERFVAFIEKHGGQASEIDQVCVPNLYLYLARQHHTLPAIIPKPGRPALFDVEDRPFLRFVLESGLPITQEHVGQFLRYFSAVVQKRYRTTASQKRSKPVLDTVESVHAHLMSYPRRDDYVRAMERVRQLLPHFTVGTLLYREYRSGSIHDVGFTVDERFYTEHNLYVGTAYLPGDSTGYLEIRVPAKWLYSLYESAVANYLAELISLRRLPLPLFLDLFEIPDDLDYLDPSSLSDGRELRFSLGNV